MCGRCKRHIKCRKYQEALQQHGQERPDAPFQLPCDSGCLHEQRLLLLSGMGKKSKGKSSLFFYSIYLWERALADAAAVQRIERQLANFLSSEEPMLSLPPAGTGTRALTHALAVYYKIRTEGIDHGSMRSCLLTRVPKSEVPPLLLSEAVLSPRNDPRVFYDRVVGRTTGVRSTSYSLMVVSVLGSNVSEVLVAKLLIDFAGSFVFGPLEELENRFKSSLVFTSQFQQREALTYLKKHSVSFQFWIPE